MANKSSIDINTLKIFAPVSVYLIGLAFAAGMLWLEIRTGNENTKKLVKSHNKLAIELFKARHVDSVYIVTDKGFDTLGRGHYTCSVEPIKDDVIAYKSETEEERRKRIAAKENFSFDRKNYIEVE